MKSEGRIEQEKAIMNKIQSIFDNAEIIANFKQIIVGSYNCIPFFKSFFF